MSTAISTVTVDDLPDKRLILSGATAARILTIGTDWTKIRIGLRLTLGDAGANLPTGTGFWFGMLADPTAGLPAGPLEEITSHFRGFRTMNAGTWTRNTTDIPHYRPAFAGATKTGIAYAQTSGATRVFSADPQRRLVIIGEIDKNSDTLAHVSSSTTNGLYPDQSYAALVNAIQASTLQNAAGSLTGGNYAVSSYTRARDATEDPKLNAICVAWDLSAVEARISEIVFAKFA